MEKKDSRQLAHKSLRRDLCSNVTMLEQGSHLCFDAASRAEHVFQLQPWRPKFKIHFASMPNAEKFNMRRLPVCSLTCSRVPLVDEGA